MIHSSLQEQFGNIDIYLLDQLFKGTYTDCKRVLDLGAGTGRNSYWFLKNGYEVYALDQNPEAIAAFQQMMQTLRPGLAASNAVCAPINANMPWAEAPFDLIICNAVLHFAQNPSHFEEMLQAAWARLKTGGYFFARLASIEGIRTQVQDLGDGRYYLPDASERYLVSDAILRNYAAQLGARPHEYIKTTLVEGLRAMSTICWQKL